MTKRTPDPNDAAGIPRRLFLKQSALAAAGLAATGGLASARKWPALRTVSAAAAKSKVVWVHHAKVVDRPENIDLVKIELG